MNMIDDGGVHDPEAADDYVMGMVDELIDIATTRHLEDDPHKVVCEDADGPYKYLMENHWSGGDNLDEVRQEFHVDVVDNGDDSYTVNPPGAAFDPKTFYVQYGQAWQSERAIFEYVKKNFEQVLSYDQHAFGVPVLQMEMTRDDLTPVADLETYADELLDADLIETDPEADEDDESAESPMDKFNVADRWDSAAVVSESLSSWHGDAARMFKGAYTDRLPSILTGQMMVARVLEQSISIVGESFKGVRRESTGLLYEATNMLELYPYHTPVESDSTDWKSVLENVAGVAGAVGGIAAVLPGPGTAIAAGAGVVAGTATLGSMVVESPEHQAAVAEPVPVEGDTVVEIMSNFNQRIGKYISVVDDTESLLARELGDFSDFVTDKTTNGATVYLTWGDDVVLSQWNSFFEPIEPALGSIGSDTGHSDISDTDMMGHAPREGEAFAADLQSLLNAGNDYLPDLGGNYSRMGNKDTVDGLEEAFTRTEHGSNPAAGDYTSSLQGPLYPVWVDLHEVFTSMLTNTGSNLSAAGQALVIIAHSFAAEDEAAAAALRESSEDFEG